jgi:hypothetical protein
MSRNTRVPTPSHHRIRAADRIGRVGGLALSLGAGGIALRFFFLGAIRCNREMGLVISTLNVEKMLPKLVVIIGWGLRYRETLATIRYMLYI